VFKRVLLFTTIFFLWAYIFLPSMALSYPPLDEAHTTHLFSNRGPKLFTYTYPRGCNNCHRTDYPHHDDPIFLDGKTLDQTQVCNNCHSTLGTYDGVNDSVIGAKANWSSGVYTNQTTSDLPEGVGICAGCHAGMTEGDQLSSGKERWCATCHDQSQCGVNAVDDFEGYTDDASLQANWKSRKDANNPTLSTGGIKGQYMSVYLEWTKDTADYGAVYRDFNSPIDLSGMSYFNFYLKIDKTKIKGIQVRLRKAGTTDICKYTFFISDIDIKSGVWKIISIPRQSFDDSSWGLVDRVVFRIYERNSSGTDTTYVYFDEIGCDFTGPNVIGDNVNWGYYITGHGTQVDCISCHNPTSQHIDGHRWPVLDHIKTTSNPTNFRFYDDPTKGMQLPYNTYDPGPEGAFALCYSCHDESVITEDLPANQLRTNFKDEACSTIGMYDNLHLIHVGAVWSITPSVYHGTCVLCHDPHGQSSPAMTRKEMGDFIYFDTDGCEITNRADWHNPAVNRGGAQKDHTLYASLCVVCHNADVPPYPDCATGHDRYAGCDSKCDGYYKRTYTQVPVGGSAGSDSLEFIAYCPVDISVIDPEADIISKELNEIPGARYVEEDFNGDGSPDDKVIIPYRKIGKYTILVSPEPGAKPTDTYTLKVIDNEAFVLAKDVPVGEQNYEVTISQEGVKFCNLLNPEDGAILSAPITFNWQGIGYNKFKLQFCPNESFSSSGPLLTLPQGEGSLLRRRGGFEIQDSQEQWIAEPYYIPTDKEWQLIKGIGRESKVIYWRLMATDAEGNVDFSESRSFSLESKTPQPPRRSVGVKKLMK